MFCSTTLYDTQASRDCNTAYNQCHEWKSCKKIATVFQRRETLIGNDIKTNQSKTNRLASAGCVVTCKDDKEERRIMKRKDLRCGRSINWLRILHDVVSAWLGPRTRARKESDSREASHVRPFGEFEGELGGLPQEETLTDCDLWSLGTEIDEIKKQALSVPNCEVNNLRRRSGFYHS